MVDVIISKMTTESFLLTKHGVIISFGPCPTGIHSPSLCTVLRLKMWNCFSAPKLQVIRKESNNWICVGRKIILSNSIVFPDNFFWTLKLSRWKVMFLSLCFCLLLHAMNPNRMNERSKSVYFLMILSFREVTFISFV